MVKCTTQGGYATITIKLPVACGAKESQTLEGDGEIDPSCPTWLLAQAEPKPDTSDYIAEIQDGCYIGQQVAIMIPGNLSNTTAPWRVTGNIAEADYLRFTNIGNSALVSWSGEAGGWVFLGGNAELVN